ncbi:MAG TPA: hypothetical protein VF414_15680 [Thermoanaerobaculia bacterium]
MKTCLCLALLVAAALAGGCGATDREGEVAHVSLIQLIASPDLHDGKRVAAIGYLRLDFEGTALYIHEIDYRKLIIQNAVWLSLGPAPISEERQRLNGRYVLVEGRFSTKQRGHFGLFPGSLTEITNIEAWPPANMVLPPGDPRR